MNKKKKEKSRTSMGTSRVSINSITNDFEKLGGANTGGLVIALFSSLNELMASAIQEKYIDIHIYIYVHILLLTYLRE